VGGRATLRAVLTPEENERFDHLIGRIRGNRGSAGHSARLRSLALPRVRSAES
jgi:hypothetical protein